MGHTVRSCGCTVFHLIAMHIALVSFSVLPFNNDFGSSAIKQTY